MEVVPVVGLELAKFTLLDAQCEAVFRRRLTRGLSCPPVARTPRSEEAVPSTRLAQVSDYNFDEMGSVSVCVPTLRLVDKHRPNLSSFSAPIAGEGGSGVGPFSILLLCF